MNIDEKKIERNLQDYLIRVRYEVTHIPKTTTVIVTSFLGKMRITEVTVDTINQNNFDVKESSSIGIEKCKHKTYDVLNEHEIYTLYKQTDEFQNLAIIN